MEFSNQTGKEKNTADGLPERPSISIESFRSVAEEVAEKLGAPIAICKRNTKVPGSETTPFQNKPLDLAQQDGSDIIEVVYP